MHWLHLFDSFVAACPKQWLDGTEDFKNTGTIDNKKVVFDSFVAACPKQCSQPPAGKKQKTRGKAFVVALYLYNCVYTKYCLKILQKTLH